MAKKMGRPKKNPLPSFIEKPKPSVKETAPEKPKEAASLLCDCGNPVAPGQTHVCIGCQKSR